MTATVIRAPHIVQPINALTGALWAVSRGLRVFRVAPNAKAPYPGGSGINEATADRATIESWFAQEPSLNYGIPMGGPEKLVALDCDKKASNFHGDYLHLEYPSTLEFVSGTGGAHIIFKAPFDASQADLKGATSINVRSEGGYIVGPGSIVNDNRYQIYADAPIVPCPPEIAARLTRRGEKAANATTPIGDMDTPAAISRAWAIVAQHHGVDEGGRDNECFRVACKIKDEGVEAETCLTILHGFNAEKVNPPLPGGDLERIVASAYANGQRPPGAANPDNEFEPLGRTHQQAEGRPVRSIGGAVDWCRSAAVEVHDRQNRARRIRDPARRCRRPR